MLRLYIAGNSPSSRRAEQNVTHLRKHLDAAALKVEVIDVLLRPDLAEQARVLATPTLSYEHAIRPRRIVGDLSDTKRVLDFLGLNPDGEA